MGGIEYDSGINIKAGMPELNSTMVEYASMGLVVDWVLDDMLAQHFGR